jgi:hypothetical protein
MVVRCGGSLMARMTLRAVHSGGESRLSLSERILDENLDLYRRVLQPNDRPRRAPVHSNAGRAGLAEFDSTRREDEIADVQWLLAWSRAGLRSPAAETPTASSGQAAVGAARRLLDILASIAHNVVIESGSRS